MDITEDTAIADYITENMNRELLRVPTQGIAAGGAIAGWIIEKTKGISIGLNDIDVFTDSETEPDRTATPTRCGTTTVAPPGSFQDTIRIVPNDLCSYVVASSTRDGILNTIEVYYKGDITPEQKAQVLLEGFDLNCCQAAMLLGSRKVVITEDFRRFLRDYQLQVTSPSTPHHTIIRLPKKVKALKCYVNYQQEYRFLAMTQTLIEDGADSNHEYNRCFGPAHIPQYLANRTDIDPFFTLCTYTRPPKNAVERSAFNHKDITLATTGLWQFIPRFKVDIPEGMGRLSIPTAAVRNLYDSMCRPKSKGITCKNSIVATRKTLLPYLLTNSAYADCQLHPKHLDRIEKFCSDHPGLAILFGKMKLNVSQQMQAIRTITAMAKKQGLLVYGIAESATQKDIMQLVSSIGPQYKVNGDISAVLGNWLRDLIAEYQERARTPYNMPLCMDGLKTPEGATVTELTTQLQLDNEGHRMKHCVAGYGNAISHGTSAIYSIEYQGQRSTLEIWIEQRQGRKSATYKLAQHRAFENRTPADDNSRIATKIVRHLNRTRDVQPDRTPPGEQPDTVQTHRHINIEEEPF